MDLLQSKSMSMVRMYPFKGVHNCFCHDMGSFCERNQSPKVIVPNNPVAHRDNGERSVGVVAEGGDEAVVHPELVAVGTDMVKKLGFEAA